MNLFDQLVNEALRTQPTLSLLRVVVEKELLHHDILRTLKQNDLLKNLTFIGGTCLRMCYGAPRLSEDLDFTGGQDFSKTSLQNMSEILINTLENKYDLSVKVSEPLKETGNVDTWKITVETRPGRKDLPAQRINIDICSVPSYEKVPSLLLNPYGIDMGTNGLIIQAQSREEIYTDKIVALGLRPNRIKYRDLWDMAWLHQQAVSPRFDLLAKKLNDRNYELNSFVKLYKKCTSEIELDSKLASEFAKEMQRFLPEEQIKKINLNELWEFIIFLTKDIEKRIETGRDGRI